MANKVKSSKCTVRYSTLERDLPTHWNGFLESGRSVPD